MYLTKSTTKFPRLIIAGLSLLATSACGAPGPAAPAEPTQAPVERSIVPGPGSFILGDKTAGLSDLSAYTATLKVTFEGTQDGAQHNWSKTYVMRASNDPPSRQWSIETSRSDSDPETLFLAEADGAQYQQRGADSCEANVGEPGESLSERLELAGLLSAVIGADEAGTDTVNGIAANHYTFDERALGQEGLTQTQGEFWLAADGGYIVKYDLTSNGEAAYFGKGIEGTLTKQYEVADVNGTVDLTLPEDCPFGRVEAPLFAGATDVVDAPGVLDYSCTGGVPEVVKFYQEQLPGLGWVEQSDSDVTDASALMHFQKGDQDLSLFVSADGETTSVTILVGRADK